MFYSKKKYSPRERTVLRHVQATWSLSKPINSPELSLWYFEKWTLCLHIWARKRNSSFWKWSSGIASGGSWGNVLQWLQINPWGNAPVKVLVFLPLTGLDCYSKCSDNIMERIPTEIDLFQTDRLCLMGDVKALITLSPKPPDCFNKNKRFDPARTQEFKVYRCLFDLMKHWSRNVTPLLCY